MPKFLALDSSTEICSVSLNSGNQVFTQISDTPRFHAQTLLVMVDTVLNNASCSLSDIDALVLTSGPGSFTGIRIGMGVAQGLAYGAALPLLTISSLEVMAFRHLVRVIEAELGCEAIDIHSLPASFSSCAEVLSRYYFVPALDARMNELYWAAYSVAEQTGFLSFCKPTVSAPEEFNQFLQPLEKDKPILGIGHGWGVKGVDTTRARELDIEGLPYADILLNLALFKVSTGAVTLDELVRADQLEPLYLRNEISWKKRTRVRNTQ